MIPTSDDVWFWLLKSSGQAAVLVLLVLAAQWLLRRRLAPCWRYSLWWLVVLRLVSPVSPESLLSIFNWTPRFAAWTRDGSRSLLPLGQPGSLATEPTQKLEPALRARLEYPFFRRSRGNEAQISSETQVYSETPYVVSYLTNVLLSDTPLVLAPSTATPASLNEQSPPVISWRQALVGVWLAGMAALLAHVGWALLRLRRWLVGARTITDTAVLKLLGDCQELMQVRRAITVLETSALKSPALCGLVHAQLLLPAGLLGRFSEPELRYVFLHELAHLKRHDIAAHWLTTLVQIVHWFNPFVWLAFNQMRADREQACDARALAASEAGEQQAYGRTIIKLLEGFAQGTPAPGLVGILENKSQLKQRIQMISHYGRHHQGHVAAVLLLIGLGLVGLTDATSASKKDTVSEQTSAAVIPPRPVVTNGPSLKVTVLDAETSVPIAGAHVYAPNYAAFFGGMENAPRWTSDAAGVAEIRLGEVRAESTRPRTWFSISVGHPGYAPMGLHWSSTSNERLQMTNEVTVRLEHGINIGGVVQDERNRPIPKVTVRVFGSGFSSGPWYRPHQLQQYAAFWSDESDSPAVVTDSAGRWEMKDFPRDLGDLAIECQRPDGSVQRFSRVAGVYSRIFFPIGDPVKLEDLRVGKAVLVLKPGFTVRGIVVDPAGKPIAGVLVKEGPGTGISKLASEFRTDSHGRFERRNRSRRHLNFTAYPTNYAITTAILDVGSNTSEMCLQLQPVSPLRLKVVDEQGLPVAGATVTVADHEFQSITTGEGTLTWTNAPRTAIALRIGAQNLQLDRLLRIPANQREVTCRLRRGENEEVLIRGQVRDADTGQPVIVAFRAMQTGEWEGFKDRERIDRSDFVYPIPVKKNLMGPPDGYRLQLSAGGYDTLITDWRGFDEGDWEAVFYLRKGGERSGYVVLENGEPVVGADVFAAATEMRYLFLREPGRVFQDQGGIFHQRTGADGRFVLEDIGWDPPVLITHAQGFLSTSLNQLTNRPRLILQPWGRVEGILHVGTQPQKDIRVCLQGGKQGLSGWHFSYDCTTDAEGRFVFDKVPPGEHLLYRNLHEGVGIIPESHPMSLNVKAGVMTKVNYGGTGRPIIGRVPGKVDWSSNNQVLVGKIPANDPAPRREDFVTEAAFEKAQAAYTARTGIRTPSPIDPSVRSHYQLRFDQDGSFRVDDVPAGTYELRLRVTQPPDNDIDRYKRQIPGKELAWLEGEVVVPAMPGGRSDTPLDLGQLTLNWADPTHPGIPAGPTGLSPK